MDGYYRAEWPILDRDTRTLAELKAEARDDLVLMVHDAGAVPVGNPEIRVSPDRRHVVAVVPVKRRQAA